MTTKNLATILSVLLPMMMLLESTAQTFAPPARGAYILSGGAWTALTGTGSGAPLLNPPTPVGLYVKSGANWVAWDGSSSGGATPTGPAGGDLAGTYPNPTVVHFATTSASTVTAPTGTALTVTSNDTSGGIVHWVQMPNVTSGQDVCEILGRSNGAFIQQCFHYVGFNDNGNWYSLAHIGKAFGFLLFGNNHITNGGADAGYNFDVAGTFRASTSTTTPARLTPNTFVGRSQTGALTQTIVASANTAAYRISMATNCHTASAATSYTSTVSYTDTSNTVQTIASGVISCTTLGIASQSNAITAANVLTGTAISLTTSTSGAVSYDVAVTAEQITAN